MPGPSTAAEALAWAKDAMEAGRYVPVPHVVQRMAERHFDMFDIHSAVMNATGIAPYDAEPENGGTNWRIFGPDQNGERAMRVGVELFRDKKRRRMVLVTVMKE